MFSQEEEQEINLKMGKLAGEYLEKYVRDATVDMFENLSIAYSYHQTNKLLRLSENLVKSTDRFKIWTITIAILTVVMIGTTIANIFILTCH